MCSTVSVQACSCIQPNAACGPIYNPGDPALDCQYDDTVPLVWSPCSAACVSGNCPEQGQQWAERAIKQQAQPGGKPCDPIVVRPCQDAPACESPQNCVPEDTWGEFMGCPACISPGSDLSTFWGIRYRNVATVASNGGQDCSYESLVQSVTCLNLVSMGAISEIPTCNIDCEYGGLNGSWSECTAPCGPSAVQYNTRSITNGDAASCYPGSLVTQTCSNVPAECPAGPSGCLEPTWDLVDAQCDYLCSYGTPLNPKTADGPILSRTFKFSNGSISCPVTQALTDLVCPYNSVTQQATCPKTQDCVYGPWSDFSSCDSTCDVGGGTKFRTRSIVKPSVFGGNPCDPNLLVDAEACATDETYDQFNDWSPAFPIKTLASASQSLSTFLAGVADPSEIADNIINFATMYCNGASGCAGIMIQQTAGNSLTFTQIAEPIAGSIKLNLASYSVLNPAPRCSLTGPLVVTPSSFGGSASKYVSQGCGLIGSYLASSNAPSYLDASTVDPTATSVSFQTPLGPGFTDLCIDTYDQSTAELYYNVCDRSAEAPYRIDDWVYNTTSSFPITYLNRNCVGAVDCSLSSWVDATSCTPCDGPTDSPYKWQTRVPVRDASGGGRPCADFPLRQTVSCNINCAAEVPCLYGEWPSVQTTSDASLCSTVLSEPVLFQNAWTAATKQTWLGPGSADFATLFQMFGPKDPSGLPAPPQELFSVQEGSWWAGFGYTFTSQAAAEEACELFGARLASMSDLQAGYTAGAQVCTDGWIASDDGTPTMAMVMQEESSPGKAMPGCAGKGVSSWSPAGEAESTGSAWCVGSKSSIGPFTTISGLGANWFFKSQKGAPNVWSSAYAPSSGAQSITGTLAGLLNVQDGVGQWCQYMDETSGYWYDPSSGWAAFNSDFDPGACLKQSNIYVRNATSSALQCTMQSKGLVNYVTDEYGNVTTECTCPSLCPTMFTYCSFTDSCDAACGSGTTGTKWMYRPVQQEPLNGGAACDPAQQMWDSTCSGTPCAPICPYGCNGEQCSGNGTCVNGVCECDPGYFGPTCIACPTNAEGVACSGRGICDETTQYTCSCTDGFTGNTCEVYKQSYLLNDTNPAACEPTSLGGCSMCADETVPVLPCGATNDSTEYPFGGYGFFSNKGTCACSAYEWSILTTKISPPSGLAPSFFPYTAADAANIMLQGTTNVSALRSLWGSGPARSIDISEVSDECLQCMGTVSVSAPNQRWWRYLTSYGSTIGDEGGILGCTLLDANGNPTEPAWGISETPGVYYPDVLEKTDYWNQYYHQTDDPDDLECMTNWRIWDTSVAKWINVGSRTTTYYGQSPWCMKNVYVSAPEDVSSDAAQIWADCGTGENRSNNSDLKFGCAGQCATPAPAENPPTDCNTDYYLGYVSNPILPDEIQLVPAVMGPAQYIKEQFPQFDAPNVVPVGGASCADLGFSTANYEIGAFSAVNDSRIKFWPVGYRK